MDGGEVLVPRKRELLHKMTQKGSTYLRKSCFFWVPKPVSSPGAQWAHFAGGYKQNEKLAGPGAEWKGGQFRGLSNNHLCKSWNGLLRSRKVKAEGHADRFFRNKEQAVRCLSCFLGGEGNFLKRVVA